MVRWTRVAAALSAAGVALTLSAEAGAQTATCDFTGKNPVYVTGSSASQTPLSAIAALLSAQATPVTLVYVKSESCAGVATFTSATAVTGTATYWVNGAPTTCNFAAGTAPLADASVSDVFSSTCPNITLTASQKEVQGPIQAMTFVVHPSSTESSISQEAAHVVMKDIANASYHITPWVDPTNIFIRPGGATGSGTRGMIGVALGLADGDWDASLTVKAGSGDVLAAVAGASAAANASLGILSVTVADKNRVGCSGTCTPVKVLTFQAKGQSCGYYPDSTSGAHDKLNVREGRYDIWGPLHFITAVDATGKPVSSSTPGTGDAAVQALITAVTMPAGATLTDAQKKAIIDATAAGYVIPQCAMRVKRSAEVGGEQSFVPDEPCGCYWDSKASSTATPASCHACGGDGDCTGQPGAPKCRYGFCEAQ